MILFFLIVFYLAVTWGYYLKDRDRIAKSSMLDKCVIYILTGFWFVRLLIILFNEMVDELKEPIEKATIYVKDRTMSLMEKEDEETSNFE